MNRAAALELELQRMQAVLDEHGRRMRSLCVDERPVAEPCGTACEHRRRLASLLRETVDALEQTRRSFKSRQIEQLRRRLTEALAELAVGE